MQPQLVDTLTVTTWLTVAPIFALLAAVTAWVDPATGPARRIPKVGRANDTQRNRLVAISPAEVRRG